MIQEHALPRESIPLIAKQAAARLCKFHATPPEPHAAIPCAGTAVIAARATKACEIAPVTQAFKRYRDCGRVIAVIADIGLGFPVRFLSIYGWTNTNTNREARERTAELFAAIFVELSEQPRTPTVLAGDFNGDLAKIPELHAMISEGNFTDLGSIQALTGQSTQLPTCRAHGSKTWTTRDFVVVSTDFLPWIKSIEVITTEEFDTHRPLRVHLHRPQ